MNVLCSFSAGVLVVPGLNHEEPTLHYLVSVAKCDLSLNLRGIAQKCSSKNELTLCRNGDFLGKTVPARPNLRGAQTMR
ncbi:MAG: hypothetical protein ACLQNE_37500, partial [Thermoguttaceae bacterium]